MRKLFDRLFGKVKEPVVSTPVISKTPEEILELETRALEELRERWGVDQIYKVRISADETNKLSIRVSCSEFMFFAWDDPDEWDDVTWGTAKSNLDSIFATDSEFKDDSVICYEYSYRDALDRRKELGV